MIPDGYRVLFHYSSDKECFVATVPELDGIRVEAKTRAEALTQVEEAIEAAFRKAAEDGREMSQPLDVVEFSGELSLTISPTMHRELTFLAQQDKVEPEALAAELIGIGMGSRSGRRRSRNASSGERHDRGGQNKGGRKRGRQRRDYHNIMDDRASFIEYVRGTEKGKGGGGRGRSRSGGRGRGKK